MARIKTRFIINVLDVEREAMQFDIMYLVFWEFEGVIKRGARFCHIQK